MKVIGLTGGIGAGKSTIARVFSILGAPVFDADAEAKRAYDDPEVREAVMARFGPQSYAGHAPNRNVLSALVFSDEQALKDLNGIIHPWVRKSWVHWLSEQTAPYVIREAAILIESGGYKDCDAIIAVTAPESLRINRVMTRSQLSRDEVLQRMSRQMSDASRAEYAHYLLVNDESALLLPEILRLDGLFRS